MASDRDPSSSWRNPEVSSASGGHAASEVRPTSWLDEQRAQVRSTQGLATQTEPRPTTTSGDDQSRRRRIVVRRVRREIRRIDPVSVLKLSLFFYGVFMIVWLFVWAVIYQIASSAGLFDSIHKFGRLAVIPSLANLDVSLLAVEKWAFLFGLLITLFGSLLNALVAFIYNVGSEMVGGVGVTFLEKDT